jgi:hypothetical protein
MKPDKMGGAIHFERRELPHTKLPGYWGESHILFIVIGQYTQQYKYGGYYNPFD